MGVADGLAHGQEQAEAVAQVQVAPGAPGVDGHTVDELHHQVGPAVGSHATVQQPRDVGMVQVGQDLALGAEAAQHLLAVHAPAHQLQRHLLAVLVVGAHGAVDHAHAAGAHPLDDAVGADQLALEGIVGQIAGRGIPGRRSGQEIVVVVGGQQRGQLGCQGRILGLQRGQPRGPFTRRQVGEFGEEGGDCPPALGIHGSPVP